MKIYRSKKIHINEIWIQTKAIIYLEILIVLDSTPDQLPDVAI